MVPVFPFLASLYFLSSVCQAVIIFPGEGIQPRPYVGTSPAKSERDLFRNSAPGEILLHRDGQGGLLDPEIVQIILSSHPGLNESHEYHPSSDSFVRGAIEAWAQHQHLIIRPDEVWFTVLTQMNFYMNAHANDSDVRSVFVAHDGKEKIVVDGNNWKDALESFQTAIQARVKTDWLLDWIQPKFSTSTENDGMTANVLMMGLMQQYFDYEMSIICGLPSVTLLGNVRDWERLVEKIELLPAFGQEPREYRARLKPILNRFVQSFRSPDSPIIRGFWSKIVLANPPGPPSNLCGAPSPQWGIGGWIVGFHYWDAEGNPYGREVSSNMNDPQTLTLDNVRYPVGSLRNFPVGYAKVPVTMVDVGEAYVLAGSIGKRIWKGMPDGYMEAARLAKHSLPDVAADQHSILQPGSAWMLYGPSARQEPISTTGIQADPVIEAALNKNLGDWRCPWDASFWPGPEMLGQNRELQMF